MLGRPKPDWVKVTEQQELATFSYEQIRGRAQYQKYLLRFQKGGDPFPRSRNPLNPDLISATDEEIRKRYADVMIDYQDVPPHTDKTDYAARGPNIGHKLHLNIQTSSALEAARYLRAHQYHHKFASGGDLEEGKTFTVYVGSQKLAFALARELSLELGPILSRPKALDDVEYAPNVVGRFSTSNGKYSKYGVGVRGMSVLGNLAGLRWAADADAKKKLLAQTFVSSYEALANEYGEYFHG